jgi:pyruvate dehydrogenase (quinone)
MGPAHLVNVVGEAIKTALMRRPVAHITIPKDIQEWTSSEEERSKANIAKQSSAIDLAI